MSDQSVASGQFVTRDEFARLESKVDEVLHLIKGQISLSSSRTASSHGPETGVYDSTEVPIFKKQDGATYLEKDINSQDKIDDSEDQDSFIVLDPSSKNEELETSVKEPADTYTSLPNVTNDDTRGNTQSSHMTVDYQVKQLNQRVKLLESSLSDKLNVSVKEVISEYQKGIQEIKDTASSYQAEMQETVKSLEDIHDMTGRLSNQLITVVEETRDVRRHLDDAITDVLQNIQTSQSSEKKVTSLSTESIEELKGQIKDDFSSAESSIKANIRVELAWFKEHIDESVKSQVCQVLYEVKEANQETEKWTTAISQEIQASRESVVQEIQTSATVITEQVGEILEEVKSSNTTLSEDMMKSTETITQNIFTSTETLTQHIQTSATSVREKIDQSIDDVTATVNDSVGKSIKQARDEIQKTVESHGETMKENINGVRETVESHGETIKDNINGEREAVESHGETIKENINGVRETAETYNERMEKIQKTIESHDEKMEKKTAQIQQTIKSHDEKMEKKTAEIQRTIKGHDEKMEKKTAEIQKTIKSHDEKMEKKTAEMQQTIESHDEKMEKKTAEMQQTIVSHDEKMEKKTAEMQQTIESHDEKMEEKTAEIQKTVESHDEKMEEKLQDSLNQQTHNTKTHVDTKMTENTKQLIRNMYQLKREIFAFTEKECQIIRDRIEGPLPSHKLYTLDFYVEDFRSLIKSDVSRYSPPWHINQFKSTLQGNVLFSSTGKLTVWMLYGRHPCEVGLQPRQCGKLKVKATITDTTGQLPDIEVGENTWTFSEEHIKGNDDWGCFLGEIDCQDIVDRGYTALQYYVNGAVLVRFLVEVL